VKHEPLTKTKTSNGINDKIYHSRFKIVNFVPSFPKKEEEKKRRKKKKRRQQKNILLLNKKKRLE
jgi:hypothetical protein